MTCASRSSPRRARAAAAAARPRSSSPAGASVRSAARSLAERARGLAAISASSAVTGRPVRMRKLGGGCTASGAWREPALRRPRAVRNVLTMRSSSEWNDDHDQPAARPQHALGGCKRGGELVELLVDEDAQRLEGARRRMDRAGPRMHDAPDDLGERAGGARSAPSSRARTMARATARACRSSPSVAMIAARSRSEARATTSAALGPAPPMRMSSGPSRRNEKPRAASSSCIDDTPRSSTTPSTAS